MNTTNMTHASIIERFMAARRAPNLAVLEGFHPIKHALRFGAEILLLVTTETTDRSLFKNLLAQRSSAMGTQPEKVLHNVPGDVFSQLAPVPPKSGLIALARRPVVSANQLLSSSRNEPLIVLERPSHMGNIGASIRVAASAGASGLIVVGPTDPWHPAALRGAAGLHYALPIAQTNELSAQRNGPLIGIDPQGEPLVSDALPDNSVLVFGSESRGLSPELRSQINHRVAIPMQPGVSSLNLATAVAITLYTWRLAKNI